MREKLFTKIILILNILIIIANFVNNYFYQLYNFDYTLKCVGSALFVLIGIINLIYVLLTKKDKQFAILMSVALVLAMLGDIIINKDFAIGAITFALGHIVFVISYFLTYKINKLDFILSSIIGAIAISLILFLPIITFENDIDRIICLVYAIIISFMLGKAISNFIRFKTYTTGTIAVASFLFFFSDFMLLLAWFSTLEGRWMDNLCMGTYYPGLCLLAFSIFMKDTLISDIK